MTDKITAPITPDTLDPRPLGTLSGDWHDDDADVYQDDFSQADHRPPEKVTGVPHEKPEIKVATRLLSRDVVVGTVNGALVDPVMIFPADVNRKTLTLVVTGTATGSFLIASDKGACYNGTSFYAIANTNTVLSLDGHTGAVWAYSVAATSVSIVAVAVSE